MAKDRVPRLIELAAHVLGSAQAVRTALGVSEAEFDAWLNGSSEPPIEVLERLVALALKIDCDSDSD